MNLLKRLKCCYDFFLKPYKLDKKKVALNCFFNQPLFQKDNIKQQADDVKNNLGVDTVRVLFHWNEAIQPSQSSPIAFGFYDEILSSLPKGLKALVIVNGSPNWLENIPNPRKHFMNYCHKIIDRYKSNDSVIGFEIGNEPNTSMFHENEVYAFVGKPAFYFEVLHEVYLYAKKVAPDKLIVAAATTSIIQDFPKSLNYHKKLSDWHEEDFCDVFAIHYYGNNPWGLLKPNGVLDFLQSLKKPIWVTEVGCEDGNKHISYLNKHMGFLVDKVPQIEKVFWYHYDGEDNYCLRYADGRVSYLYTYLKES